MCTKIYNDLQIILNFISLIIFMQPIKVGMDLLGLEPTTFRLTAERSTDLAIGEC